MKRRNWRDAGGKWAGYVPHAGYTFPTDATATERRIAECVARDTVNANRRCLARALRDARLVSREFARAMAERVSYIGRMGLWQARKGGAL